MRCTGQRPHIAGLSRRLTFLVNPRSDWPANGHRARSPTEGTVVSWRLLLMPPLCVTLAQVSIRRGDSGTARRTIQAPFRRRQNALIWTITLMSAPDRQAVEITAGTRAQALPAVLAERHGRRGSQAT
jgi:hypothetical protein